MGSFAIRICCVFFLFCAAVANGASNTGQVAQKVTPIEKVISLMKELSKKVEEEGKVEAKQYDDYACFCKEQADGKLYNIETSREKIAKLTAKIENLEGEIATLTSEISDLATKIAGLEADIKAAVDQRAKEHAKYVTNSTDIVNAISAVERAIKALRESKGEIKGNEYYDAKLDFAQVQAATGKLLAKGMGTPKEQAKAAAVLTQLTKPGQAAGYEYHSNDIIAVLEGLKDSFLEFKKEMDEEEFKLQDAFEKKKLAMENEKKFAEQDKMEKEAVLEAKTEEKEQAEQDKAEETKDMNADQSFLNVLTADCEKKAGLWDQRSRVRAGELTALSQALEVLEAKALPSYSVNKKLVDLQKKTKLAALQKRGTASGIAAHATKKTMSFLQTNGQNSQKLQDIAAGKAIDFLMTASHNLGSPALSAAVLIVSAAKDHFVEVRGLIKDLLARLEADAAAEAEQKSFCDREMAKAINNRDAANAGVEDTEAQITALTTEKEGLMAEIATLSDQIAKLQKALLEATELRAKEKAENEETIATATTGKEGVELALQILKEFYEGAAAELLQKYVPPDSDREGHTVGDLAPEVFDTKYKGAQAEGGGIIGILEVVLSDFERTIATTQDEEEMAQEDFEIFEADTKTDIATKERMVKTKQARVADLEDELVTLQNDLKSFEELLASAKEELSKIEAMCVEGEETYAERVAARKKEIEALKEALTILENWQS